MKKRIGDRLSALAAQQQGDEAARLRAAAEGIGRANISTIDGFCSHVLRRHFDIAGLGPPSGRVKRRKTLPSDRRP